MNKTIILYIRRYIFLLLISIFLILFLFFLFYVFHISSEENEVSELQEEKTVFKYRYLSYNEESKVSNRGITELSYPLFGDDFVCFQSEDDHKLISNFFGIDEYICTGSCHCGENNNRRRQVSVGGKSLTYFVAAVTSLVALNIAKKHFDEVCVRKISDDCSDDESEIHSEVENCERFLASDDDLKPHYFCHGRCVDDISIPKIPSNEIGDYYEDEDNDSLGIEDGGNWCFPQDRTAWRNWLEENHRKEKEVWLIKYKVHTKKQSISWSESVDEALCYGWIDGVVKRIDDEKHKQRFTPRRKGSNWSKLNLSKFRRLKLQGRVSKFGNEAYNEWINKHRDDETSQCDLLQLDTTIVLEKNERFYDDQEKKAEEIFLKEYLHDFCVRVSEEEISKENEEKRISENSKNQKKKKKTFSWGRCGKWVKCKGYLEDFSNPTVSCLKM